MTDAADGTNRASVTAKCVGCGHRRKIKAGEVPEGRHPTCPECHVPMVAIAAERPEDREET